MTTEPVLIGFADRVRLRRFITAWEAKLTRDGEQLSRLRARLAASVAIAGHEIPNTLLTIGTQVRLRDLDRGRSFVWTVALPADEEVALTARSPLSWSGATLLGAREGDVLEWESHAGRRKVRIEAVLFQPEAGQQAQPRTRRRVRAKGGQRADAKPHSSNRFSVELEGGAKRRLTWRGKLCGRPGPSGQRPDS